MPGPLHGIRILDLTTVAFGPYATQILGDYGAEVIKVESPEGDITRNIAPFRNPGMGHFFIHSNRNKRCLVLDLKQPQGRDAFLRIAATVDAVVCSVRPAAMARLGLGYDDIRAVNPDIVYAALVGFGQAGPYAKRPAYDDIIQGMSGMADMQGGRSGPPRFVNASIADKISSQVVAHAVLAALFARERGAGGQMVEIPMYESLVAFNMVEHSAGQTFDPPLGPAGYERSMVEYRKPYPTTDGHVCVLPYNTKQWRAFFRRMSRDDLAGDPRVTDPKLRSEKIGELYVLVADLVKDWTTADLLAALEEADVPHGKVGTLAELPEDPHLKAVGLFRHIDHPTEGRVRVTRPPMSFEKTPAEIRTLPAALGEHSAAVLAEAGYTPGEIAALVEAGVTVDGRVKRDAAG